MNIELLNKLETIDHSFRYKLTIVTNIKFSYTNNDKRKNRSLFETFTKKHLIHKLSKLTKQHNKKKDNEFLCIGSFEYRKTDRLIHYHYLFSFIDNSVIKDYQIILERWKKDKIIYDFELKPYIPYEIYKKDHVECSSFSSYILKEADNELFPIPFFSKDLTNLINQKTL